MWIGVGGEGEGREEIVWEKYWDCIERREWIGRWIQDDSVGGKFWTIGKLQQELKGSWCGWHLEEVTCQDFSGESEDVLFLGSPT